MTKKVFIIIIIYVLFIWDSYAQQNKTVTQRSIKIGLLIGNDESISAQNGATLAIDKANEKEGSDGLHFQLLVRSMEGPWGTGSKETVNLVFNEKVWAILGSHDGRNAHLVEQVIAKTHIVFLSAWASDPTLYQAFVPWFFSCVPNDLQQANILIKEIIDERKLSKIIIISDKSYDSKVALKSFLRETKKVNKVELMQLFYDSSNKDFKYLFEKINKSETDCIVLFGKPTASKKFIQQLRQNEMNLPVFGTLSLLAEDSSNKEKLTQLNNITLVTSGNWFDPKKALFNKEYYNKYGNMPGAVAAYAFDGMNLIIEAIKHSGLNREKMQETMSNIHYTGVTGSIQFDKKGIRMDAAELIEIKNGIPISLEK